MAAADLEPEASRKVRRYCVEDSWQPLEPFMAPALKLRRASAPSCCSKSRLKRLFLARHSSRTA